MDGSGGSFGGIGGGQYEQNTQDGFCDACAHDIIDICTEQGVCDTASCAALNSTILPGIYWRNGYCDMGPWSSRIGDDLFGIDLGADVTRRECNQLGLDWTTDSLPIMCEQDADAFFEEDEMDYGEIDQDECGEP
eukprot:COSAG05_NODE_9022_length_654_cov_0.839640_1_plen_134_part_10